MEEPAAIRCGEGMINEGRKTEKQAQTHERLYSGTVAVIGD